MAANGKIKVLFFDIEVAPLIGTTWGLYDTNVVWSIQDWYILCFAYKWEGERKTHVVAQPDFPGYKAGSPDDRRVVEHLHSLFNEADVLVAQNGDRFDVKKANARFIYHGLTPPAPSLQVDTLKMARKYFGFTSNKLNDLGEFLGVGKKLKTDKDLWRECMAGDMKSWRKMKQYNVQDVRLLEKVYLKLRPFDVSHPNRANIEGRPEVCPRCGVEGFLLAQGWRFTKTGKYRRWQCTNCGSYVSSRKAEKGTNPDYV